MKPSQRIVTTTVAVLLVSLGAMNATAADLSVDQVSTMLKSASPSMPADFTGKDLSDLDLSRLDFRGARLSASTSSQASWSKPISAVRR